MINNDTKFCIVVVTIAGISGIVAVLVAFGGIYIREVLAGENKRKTKVCLFFLQKERKH